MFSRIQFFTLVICALLAKAITGFPKGTKLGKKDLVTQKTLDKVGKTYVMVLGLHQTILIMDNPAPTFKGCAQCLVGYAIGKRLEPDYCAILRNDFVNLINAYKGNFLFVLYGLESSSNMSKIGKGLEKYFDNTANFQVRARKHMHILPGEPEIRCKDLRNVVHEDLFPMTVIIENKLSFYEHLPEEHRNTQLACLIKVQKFNPPKVKIVQKGEKRYYFETSERKAYFAEVINILAPISETLAAGSPPVTLRDVLNRKRIEDSKQLGYIEI